MLRGGIVIGAMLALSACASEGGIDRPVFERPETALAYTVAIEGMPEPEMVGVAEAALQLYRLQDDGAPSLAFLRRRARDDLPLLDRLLRSRGYYSGTTTVAVDPPVTEGGPAAVRLSVDPGPPFRLTRHDLIAVDQGQSTLPALDAAAFGSPVGAQARAEAIVTAENAAVLRLRRSGFVYARADGRTALADREAATIEVASTLVTGPAYALGPVEVTGLDRVEEDYLLTYVGWTQGEPVDPEDLAELQRDLALTNLFTTITVTPPETPPVQTGPLTPLPIVVTAVEGPRRTVRAGARFDTDEGPAVRLGFVHRNLFGRNETGTITAQAGLELQELLFGYREPQYLRAGQDLVAGLGFVREDNDAFESLTATAGLGLQRELSRLWTVGFGGLIEIAQIEDEGDTLDSYLFGVPTFAAYDRTDDVLDATRGQRFRLNATPFVGSFDGEFSPFLTLDAHGSTYHDLFGDRRYVLAGRGRIGSILSDSLDVIPDNRRLFSGGGGSVRGYEQRSVGPLDANGDPVGGRSVVELSGELRARLWGDFGGVVFVDAGAVSTEVAPVFDDGVQVAAGLGFRYYSIAGPIRLDVAFPLNGREEDNAVEVYFAIGQAF